MTINPCNLFNKILSTENSQILISAVLMTFFRLCHQITPPPPLALPPLLMLLLFLLLLPLIALFSKTKVVSTSLNTWHRYTITRDISKNDCLQNRDLPQVKTKMSKLCKFKNETKNGECLICQKIISKKQNLHISYLRKINHKN